MTHSLLDSEALFYSDRGGALQAWGVRKMLGRLGRIAAIEDVPVSPHNLRRTFAVNFLRNGGNLYELQDLMGHEDLTVLRGYIDLADHDLADHDLADHDLADHDLADHDLAEAHRRASPVERLLKGRRAEPRGGRGR